MMTSERRVEKVMEALEAGVNDYIVKPFRIDEVSDKIEALARSQPEES